MRHLFIFTATILILSGCSWTNGNKPSILIIAVESLPFESISCEEHEKTNEGLGFFQFCQEAIRFTHAYTSSPLSAPALTSVLTGLSPNEHKVWDNGNNYLSEYTKTITEVAQEKGYRTSLFSSGPPILRKSGLAQGFEVFNDQIKLSINNFQRPVSKNLSLFKNWLSKNSDSFFSVIYLNDLMYPHKVTKDSQSIERNKTRKSQLQEVSESLFDLFKFLKRNNRWDNTHVVLVGLNGHSRYITSKTLPPLNLGAQNTQVTLQIKPIHNDKRDLALNWKVDQYINLDDLGATLFDLLDSKSLGSRSNSFKSALYETSAKWDENRLITLESAWSSWHNIGTTRFAVRKKHYLAYNQSPMKIYNSLTDKTEKNPLDKLHPMWSEIYSESRNYFRQNDLEKWQSPDSQFLEKVFIGHNLWSPYKKKESIRNLISLRRRRSWDLQLSGWLAIKLLELNKWQSLLRLANDSNQPFWKIVALKNLKKDHEIKSASGCIKYFIHSKIKSSPTQKECKDKLLIKAIQWVQSKSNSKFEKFWREYKYRLIKQKISMLNYYYFLSWDTPISSPSGPLLADLFLELPENKKFKKKLDKRIRRDNKLFKRRS